MTMLYKTTLMCFFIFFNSIVCLQHHRCRSCPEKFTSLPCLVDHANSLHHGIKIPCPIPECSKTYPFRGTLYRHCSLSHGFSLILKHIDEGQEITKEKLFNQQNASVKQRYGASFTNNESLPAQEAIKHSGFFTCNKCSPSLSFDQQQTFYDHIEDHALADDIDDDIINRQSTTKDIE